MATARVETIARGVEGANASVDDAKRQIAAMMAMMFFMLIGSGERERRANKIKWMN